MVPFRSIIEDMRQALTPPVKRATEPQRARLIKSVQPDLAEMQAEAYQAPPRPDVLRQAQQQAYRTPQPEIDRRRAIHDYFTEGGEGTFVRGINEAFPSDYQEPEPDRAWYDRAAAPVIRGVQRVGSAIGDIPISPYQSPPRMGGQQPAPRTLSQSWENTGGRRIPYSGPVQDVAGQIGRKAGEGLYAATAGPAAPLLEEVARRSPLPSPQGAFGATGEFAFESAVPTEVWMLALEFVPEIGTVPDLMRAVRSNAPEAIAAVRTALRDPRAAEAIATARKAVTQGERGSLIPDRSPLRAAAGEGGGSGDLAGDASLPPDKMPDGGEQVRRQFTKDDPPWSMSGETWASVAHKADRPYIAEISPYQYGQMGPQQKARYDKMRAAKRAEYQAATADWGTRVREALDSGAIKLDSPDLHPDAKEYLGYVVSNREKEALATATNDRMRANRIMSPADVQAGDRVYWNRRPATVERTFKKGVRIAFDDGVAGTVDARELQWLPYDEAKKRAQEGAAINPRDPDTDYVSIDPDKGAAGSREAVSQRIAEPPPRPVEPPSPPSLSTTGAAPSTPPRSAPPVEQAGETTAAWDGVTWPPPKFAEQARTWLRDVYARGNSGPFGARQYGYNIKGLTADEFVAKNLDDALDDKGWAIASENPSGTQKPGIPAWPRRKVPDAPASPPSAPRGELVRPAADAQPGGAASPSLPADNPPAFNPSPEELAHLENLIDHGDWTETPGARIGAKSVLRRLQKGEEVSDKQMGMLMRALGSQQPSATPGVRKPAQPRVRKPKVEAPPPPRRPRIVGGDDLPPEEPPITPSAPEPAQPDRVLAGDAGAQTPLDLGAVRLADGWRNKTLADIADSPSIVQRFQNFWNGLIGTPHFIANNKKDLAAAVIQVPRTLKTAIDIGWGGRNGWRLFPKHKAAWARMYGRQYATLASEDAYTALQAQTMALPHAQRLKESGLAFLERGTGELETTAETSMSRFTQNLPVLNRTERAYIAPGNAMRYEIASDFITKWEKKHGVPMPDEMVKKLVDHYNAATLRGNTRYLAKAHAEVLGSILFSTKGLVSGPQYVAGGIKALADPSLDAMVKAEIAGDVAAYIAGGMATMGLIAVANSQTDFASVDFDTNSPTFGQVEVGPIRWNYWGSDQSMVKEILMQLPGHGGKRVIDGVTEDVGRPESAWRYISNKLAPGLPRTAWDSAVNKGRTFEGENVNTAGGFVKNIIDQTVPIPYETTKEAYGNAGPIAAIVSVLADLNGFTTSTYDLSPRISKEQYEAKKRVEASGYNDVGDRVFEKLKANGTIPENYNNYADFKDALRGEIEARLAERNIGPGYAESVLEKIPAVQTYTKTTAAVRAKMRENPELRKALIEAGVIDPTVEDLADAGTPALVP